MKSKVLFIVASAIASVILVSCEEKNPGIPDAFYNELNKGLSSEVTCPLCGEVIQPFRIDANKDGVIHFSESSAITGIYSSGDLRGATDILCGLASQDDFFPNLEHIYVENAIIVNFSGSVFPNLKCANIHAGDQTKIDYPMRAYYLGPRDAEILRIDLREARTKNSYGNVFYCVFLQGASGYDFPNLRVLELFQNGATRYTSSNQPKGLSSLDSHLMPMLEKLKLQLYTLESLDLTNNTKLTRLDCSNNKLTALDLSGNPNLTYLNIGNSGRVKGENDISVLDLKNNLEIDSVITEGNDLHSLYLGENSKLRYLSLGQCSLTEINLEKCKSLEYFDCMGFLNELNLRNCGNLKYLRIYTDNMTELDLSNNLMLEDVYLNYKYITKHLKIIISSPQQDKEWVKKYENYDYIEFEVI